MASISAVTTEVERAENAWLLCVTEMTTRDQMDKLISILADMK